MRPPELLQLLVLNSLLCVGLRVLASSAVGSDGFAVGMPLHSVRMWIDNRSPTLARPLISCLSCMASVHSVYVYWAFAAWDTRALITFPFYVLALCGLNSIAARWLDL